METKDLQTQIHDLENRLIQTEKNRDEYKSKYFQFKGIFKRQTHTFYLYQSLSDDSKEALKGIFKGTSFEEFLACGVQPGNIDALWEFSRNEALNGNEQDLPILVQIITYFVHLYNGTNDSPFIEFMTVSEGDAFDFDFHIRTQDSKPAGKISKILLPGLTNAFTGEVIKKTVVEINDPITD